MLLSELISGLIPKHVSGTLTTEITGIAYDSRKVKKGDLFVCIKGFKTDGHNFLHQALENGAGAIISEKEFNLSIPVVTVENSRIALAHCSNIFYKKPSSKFKLIGVTGTNGKTTTTYLIKSILENSGARVGLIGTNQNMIGDKVLKAERTTPESLELQQLFSHMVNDNVEYVVMEVSSHSLELYRVHGCEFDIGVFTNITRDHLDFHQSMDNYLEAKIKLFDMCKIGIINIDEKESKNIYANTKCDKISFGINQKSDILAQNIVLGQKGVEFDVITPKGNEHIEIGIPGKFTVYNALGSIGACVALNISLKSIKEGLRRAEGVPGRFQLVETGRDFSVIIDYAHTPDGLENVLNTVKGYIKGRLITVFGCGGDRDSSKRPIMGEIAGRLSDYCIITSDNPRTESPMEIINQIEVGMKKTSCKYKIIENRAEAIEYALGIAAKEDVIVLAGKGHETYQVLKDCTIPFDEKKIVQEKLGII